MMVTETIALYVVVFTICFFDFLIVMDIREIRLKNLLYAIQIAGGITKLAQEINSSEQYLRQVIEGTKKTPPGGFGKQIATKVAAFLGEPPKWMDQKHPELWADYELEGKRSPSDTESAKDSERGQLHYLVQAAVATLLDVADKSFPISDAECARVLGTTFRALEWMREGHSQFKENEKTVFPTDVYYCSFCDKPSDVADGIISKPDGPSICDECVMDFYGMVTDTSIFDMIEDDEFDEDED